MPAPETVLSLREASVSASLAGGEVEVLRRISLSLGRGRVLGLVGESGAGKSMIGRLVSGLLPEGFRLSHGRVDFCGEDLSAHTPAERRALLGRRIAFVPQEPLSALDPVMSVGGQFDEHLSRLGIPRSRRAALAARQLAEVHLPEPHEMLRRYPHELSGGQCQRVLIALAFASQPALLIADEPTTALDVLTQARIMRLLWEQQRAHGTAVLLITHDLRLAAHVCDDVGVMYAGDLVELGPAATVLREPFHPYTRSLKFANPPLEGERRVLPVVSEYMPGLTALAQMPGCRFAPRCPARDARCAAELPPLREFAPGHFARCTDPCSGERRFFELGMPLAPSWPAQGEAPAVVEFRNVSLTYRARRGLLGGKTVETHAVRDASFSVCRGEFVGVVGESGSGKSSIARLVVGLETPTEGEVLIDGKAPGRDARALMRVARESIQMVFQDPQSALNPRRSVLRLVTQALEAPGRERAASERERRARELLRETGLPEDALERFPSQLSGGQRQRVNIARALCVTPRLLVADEIVSGLDVSVQAQIMNLLLRLGSTLQVAVLFISHDLSVIRYLCPRVLVMHRGEIVEAGETAEVFANPQHPYTRTLLAAVPPDDRARAWPPEEAPPSASAATA
jgi:peptide/nickel transport system ATP-binding protein